MANTRPSPTTLEGAHAALLLMLSAEQIEGLKAGSLEAALQHHHGIGRFIRNEWLRHGSLGQVFMGLQLRSLDDMSALILGSLARKLRQEPFELSALAAKMGIGQP